MRSGAARGGRGGRSRLERGSKGTKESDEEEGGRRGGLIRGDNVARMTPPPRGVESPWCCVKRL